jgi:hypothetical protein
VDLHWKGELRGRGYPVYEHYLYPHLPKKVPIDSTSTTHIYDSFGTKAAIELLGDAPGGFHVGFV